MKLVIKEYNFSHQNIILTAQQKATVICLNGSKPTRATSLYEHFLEMLFFF